MIEQRISELTAAILTLVAVIQAQGSAAPKAETPAAQSEPKVETVDNSKAEAAKAKAEKDAAAKAAKEAKAKAEKDAADAAAKAKADEEAAAKAATTTLPDLTAEIQKALQPILKQKKLVQAKEILSSVGGGAPSFSAIPREKHEAVLQALQSLELS